MISRARLKLARSVSIVDVLLLIGVGAFVYAMIGVAQEWASPFRPKTEIDLGLGALAEYSFFSLVRVSVSYFLCLVFAVVYGYWAAKSRAAEPILIALLDILQSVPVLGFMPGLVLALVNLFPKSNVGLEFAAIIMIFTGQGWNMVFSFYTSVKTVPTELREMASLYGLNRWQVLRTIELPFSANGMLWNSMLGMAGGWFFLMVIESFTLGDKDFRLPGLGAYMAVAYEKNDIKAIIAGILAMFILIVLVDRCIWAPLVVWSERFKFERDPRQVEHRSFMLEWLKRSRVLAAYGTVVESVQRRVAERYARDRGDVAPPRTPRAGWRALFRAAKVFFLLLGAVVVVYGLKSMVTLVAATTARDWLGFVRDTLLTFVRVIATTILGAVWTVPLGVFIGTHPVWTRRLEPVVQIVASFPAPMLFPMLTSMFLAVGLKLGMGSILLMLFASQWYILFNVISGASLIPHSMLDLAEVFHVRGIQLWRAILLPAIYPSLINGLITAAGGAWNACIVAEIVQYGKVTLETNGIGASITKAAQTGNYPILAGAVLTMVTTVVLLNRFVWGWLYRLAETRFRLES